MYTVTLTLTEDARHTLLATLADESARWAQRQARIRTSPGSRDEHGNLTPGTAALLNMQAQMKAEVDVIFDLVMAAKPAPSCEDCGGKGVGCCVNADIPLPGTER